MLYNFFLELRYHQREKSEELSDALTQIEAMSKEFSKACERVISLEGELMGLRYKEEEIKHLQKSKLEAENGLQEERERAKQSLSLSDVGVVF
jgi:NAD dependent epimerase/dehydratase family enzyme